MTPHDFRRMFVTDAIASGLHRTSDVETAPLPVRWWWSRWYRHAVADLTPGTLHRWWATTAGPALGERSTAQRRLTALHASPAHVTAEEWEAALRPALTELFRWAYPYEDAFAVVSAAGEAYASARGCEPEQARSYGDAYARLNTDANVRVSAEANAAALAAALATAYSGGDPEALCLAYPEVVVRAVLRAVPHALIEGPA